MAITADEVWQLLGELIQSQKETERQIQQVNAQLGKLGSRGLFVLAQSGESVIILNDAQFQPRVW